MEDLSHSSLFVHLSSLEDPRSGENSKYNITEVLFIAVCSVLAGCESWYQMEDFGEAKSDWLSSFLDLKNGTPSHDTFRRVFTLLDFESFQEVFTTWTAEVKRALKIKTPDQICIDGKTLRGSVNKSKALRPLHMVHAWSLEASLNLGQVCTDEKSNEITAIPKLLNMLNIEGCLVSIDAMGCQREIADQIISKGGDFLFAVKGNQAGLQEVTKETFRRHSKNAALPFSKSSYQDSETSHGRRNKRNCTALSLKDDETAHLFVEADWPEVKTLIRIKSDRLVLSSGEKSKEVRYYVSSAILSAEEACAKVRSHWEVENKLHWCLDVAMAEDKDQKWARESAKNFALLRQFALNLLRKFPDKKKRSIKRKKTMAAIDSNYLMQIWLQ